MKLLKEPLLHFILIGAAFFLLFKLTEDSRAPDTDVGGNDITISEARIEHLKNTFVNTWKRAPKQHELERIVQNYIIEEIYYRKAIEMKIDVDDTIIRRRLKQKFEFLTDGLSSIKEPSDQELLAYIKTNQDQFATDAHYSFQQIYIRPQKHADLDTYIEQQLTTLQQGGSTQSDSNMLPARFTTASSNVIRTKFGNNFLIALKTLPTDTWTGPINSGYGVHLIHIDPHTAGQIPPLDKIRNKATKAWQSDRKQEMREALNKRLIEEHNITINWPDAHTS